MSNLQSAKSAIKAEIAHAREGIAFYQTRLETLEKTLDQLDAVSLDEDIDLDEPSRRTTARGAIARGPIARRGRPARKQRGRPASAAGKDLPATGAEFWLDLISEQPQTAAEILKQAISRLDFAPDRAQIQKLRQRLSPGLKSLLDTSRIQDTGSGRQRRYFKG